MTDDYIEAEFHANISLSEIEDGEYELDIASPTVSQQFLVDEEFAERFEDAFGD